MQAALSVVLLVGAGLFVRSLFNVQHVRLGYDAEHLLYVRTNWRGIKTDSGRPNGNDAKAGRWNGVGLFDSRRNLDCGRQSI